MDATPREASPRSWPGPDPFEAVLRRAQRGDEDAFACLWRWLHPAVVGWLRTIAPAAADDAAAEAWLSVAEGLGQFQGGAPAFRSWVFTIAKRRAVDDVRAAVRRPATEGLGAAGEPATPEPDPSIAVTERDSSEEALRLLGRLPPAQAEVVALRVVAGLSVSEVAEVVDRSEGAVRVLAHRGVQSLARLVDGGRGDDLVDAVAHVTPQEA